MKTPARFVMIGLAGTLLLAGCGKSEKQPTPNETDPALTGALGDQIMVDPDKAGGQGSAVAPEGRQITLPPQDVTPEAIAAAKKQASAAAGGNLKPAPNPSQGKANPLAQNAATAAQIAQGAKAASADCSAKVQYSNTWAAKLPPELPVYPRGAVQEAAGVENQDCELRVVNFATPVSVDDVMSFYYTKVAGAGYSAQHKVDGNEHVLGGKKGGKAYVVYARKQANGLTEVDLISSGK